MAEADQRTAVETERLRLELESRTAQLQELQLQQQSMVGELEKRRCKEQVSRGGALLALQINSACPQTFSARDTIQ